MRPRSKLALVFALTLCGASAHAVPDVLPREELAAVAGAAAQGEVALVESKPDGTMKQVTLVSFVRAPVQLVHDLVADVGGYPKFVPNLVQASFTKDARGAWINDWKLELPISSFSGHDAYTFDPDPAGAISFHSLETLATYRWDFISVDGGTLLVQTGYADVLHANRFVRAFVRRQPPLEHGLGLAAQYMIVSAIRDEAQRRSGGGHGAPSGGAAALVELSRRGTVIRMRSSEGKLAEVSVLDRIYAPLAKVQRVIATPSEYKEFIAGVETSTVKQQSGDDLVYSLEMALPVLTWDTTYQLHVSAQSIDGAGIEGDLRGARFRYDLRAVGERETLLTYRVSQPLGRSSLIARKLFAVDASIEYGLNVAFAILQVRSIRGRAEGWPTK